MTTTNRDYGETFVYGSRYESTQWNRIRIAARPNSILFLSCAFTDCTLSDSTIDLSGVDTRVEGSKIVCCDIPRIALDSVCVSDTQVTGRIQAPGYCADCLFTRVDFTGLQGFGLIKFRHCEFADCAFPAGVKPLAA